MIANIKKTKVTLTGSPLVLKNAEELGIHLSSNKIDEITMFNYLGLHIQNMLPWKAHIDRLCQRSYSKLKILIPISGFLPIEILLRIYNQTILPMIDYGSIVRHDSGSVFTEWLEKNPKQSYENNLKGR